MSDLLVNRESIYTSFGDASNPIGLDGVEFIEYVSNKPQALGQILELMGFKHIARHRSREVLLYRQGEINIVVNAQSCLEDAHSSPSISAIALRVRDAAAAYKYVLAHGAWEVQTHAQVMELNIPAIHGPGGCRIYFVDRYHEFSIYDVDFVPVSGVNQNSEALVGIHFFGLVQYIDVGRSNDWIEFYRELLGMSIIPDEQRFGIMPKGTLMRSPTLRVGKDFLLQLVEPEIDAMDANEQFQRIGLGVPDVLAAVNMLRQRGIEFVGTESIHPQQRGAITKTYLGSVVFELVHSPQPNPEVHP